MVTFIECQELRTDIESNDGKRVMVLQLIKTDGERIVVALSLAETRTFAERLLAMLQIEASR
jgi:hypothetical protein